MPSRWPALLKPDREGCGKGPLLAHMQCPLPPSQQPEVRCAAIASTGTSTDKPFPLLSGAGAAAREGREPEPLIAYDFSSHEVPLVLNW